MPAVRPFRGGCPSMMILAGIFVRGMARRREPSETGAVSPPERSDSAHDSSVCASRSSAWTRCWCPIRGPATSSSSSGCARSPGGRGQRSRPTTARSAGDRACRFLGGATKCRRPRWPSSGTTTRRRWSAGTRSTFPVRIGPWIRSWRRRSARACRFPAPGLTWHCTTWWES